MVFLISLNTFINLKRNGMKVRFRLRGRFLLLTVLFFLWYNAAIARASKNFEDNSPHYYLIVCTHFPFKSVHRRCRRMIRRWIGKR